MADLPFLRHVEWRAAVVLTVCLFGGVGLWSLLLLDPPEVSAQRGPVLVAGALLWTGWAGYVAVRRRLGPVDGSLVIGSVIVLLVVEGLTFEDSTMKWLCVCALLVTPLMAQMLLPVRGVVLATAAASVGGLLVVAGMPASAPLKAYALATALALLLSPVSAVGVLVHQLRVARDLAQRSATTDHLTGLLNRRGLVGPLPEPVPSREQQPARLTVVVIDIDHFKQVNDRHGHQCGDDVLVAVADVLARQTRDSDLLVRMGGEEFAWVTTFPDADRALAAAERARAAVAALHRPGLPAVTVSLGLAMADPGAAPARGEHPLSPLLVLADRALYEAKRTGRDRVVLAPVTSAAPPPGRGAAPGAAAVR